MADLSLSDWLVEQSLRTGQSPEYKRAELDRSPCPQCQHRRHPRWRCVLSNGVSCNCPSPSIRAFDCD